MLLMEYEYFQGLGPYVSWWNVCLACMHSSVPRTKYTKYGISCLPSESSEDRGMRKRSYRLVWDTWESVSKISTVRIQSFAYCLYIELQSVFYHISHGCTGSILGFCFHRFIGIFCNMTMWSRTHCPLLLFLPIMKILRLQYQRELVRSDLIPRIYKGKILRFSLWSTMLAVSFHSNYQTRWILFCSSG